MTDARIIQLGIAQASIEGREIDDRTARIIANCFHDGSARALAFVSTGAIDSVGVDGLWHVFAADYREHGAADREALNWLGTYLLHAGERGPVEGWADLNW